MAIITSHLTLTGGAFISAGLFVFTQLASLFAFRFSPLGRRKQPEINKIQSEDGVNLSFTLKHPFHFSEIVTRTHTHAPHTLPLLHLQGSSSIISTPSHPHVLPARPHLALICPCCFCHCENMICRHQTADYTPQHPPGRPCGARTLQAYRAPAAPQDVDLHLKSPGELDASEPGVPSEC